MSKDTIPRLLKRVWNFFSEKTRRMMKVSLGLLLLIVFYKTVFIPQAQDIKKLKKERHRKEKDYQKLLKQKPPYEQKQRLLDIARQSIPPLQEQLTTLESQLSHRGHIPQLLEQLSVSARDLSVEFLSIRPKIEKQTNRYAHLSIEVKCLAPYADLVNYMNRLESISGFLNTTRVELEHRSADGDQLAVTLHCETLLDDHRAGSKDIRLAFALKEPIAISRDPFIAPGIVTLSKEDRASWRLSGIHTGGPRPVAIINDNVYGVGDTMDQHTISAILADRVILSDGQQELFLDYSSQERSEESWL